MMLRIAKPMNYIPVSPSVEQRGAWVFYAGFSKLKQWHWRYFGDLCLFFYGECIKCEVCLRADLHGAIFVAWDTLTAGLRHDLQLS